MSLTLSSEDLTRLDRTFRALLSPLDHPDANAWRSLVNREVKELLGADMAGFLLPVESGPLLYSEDFDPAVLAQYPELPPPPTSDGTPGWKRGLEMGAWSITAAYGPEPEIWFRSPYYHEYIVPNRAFDTVGLSSLVPGAGTFATPDSSPAQSILQCWHERPDGRRFGEREFALLRLLFPVFQAGVGTYATLARHRADLLRSLDRLGQALLVCDCNGRVLHQTPALTRVLDEDPDRERLSGGTRGLIRRLAEAGDRRGRWEESDSAVVRTVATGTAEYRIQGSYLGAEVSGGETLLLISIERLTPRLPSEDAARERFGLTRQQARVALLLAQGRSNEEVARVLSISPHTAKRHTERVFLKLGVGSRSEVGPRMLQR